MPAGRPTDYTDELADRICDQIESGVPVIEICAKPDMPSQDTYYRWKREKPEFSEKITHARQERLESDREQLRALGRRALEDMDIDHNRINSAVNAIDKAARLTAPKTRTEVTGKDGAPLVPETSERDIARHLAAILKEGAD